MTRSDDLAAESEADREARERRAATGATVRQLTRTGTALPPASVVDALLARRQRRLDGTDREDH